MKNCQWDFTTIKNTEFNFCQLDAKTAYFISKDSNEMATSSLPGSKMSWEDVDRMEAYQRPEEGPEMTITMTIMRLLKIAA